MKTCQSLFTAAWIATATMMTLGACSDTKDITGEEFTPTVHLVKGKVEKGPLVRGSQIELRTLDRALRQTGNSYTTTIKDNSGRFDYDSLTVNSPYAKLTADGYFFNEVAGRLSDGTVKLDAIVDLNDASSVNVNVLTHLKSRRIEYLVNQEGKGFQEANRQAQRELLTQFGLQAYADKDASLCSITSGDDTAGVLIAVSSLVLSDRSEAEIVEYLSQLCDEFAPTGTFSDTTRKRIRATRNYLNGRLDEIAGNIRKRYEELGHAVTVKDLAHYFDWDNDGIAGNELDGADTVKLSQRVIEVPVGGGDFTVRVESDKPYFLDPPSKVTGADNGLSINPDYQLTEENFSDGLYASGTDTDIPQSERVTTIEGNVVKLHIGPARSRGARSWSVPVYNARGRMAAKIDVTQRGDPSAKTVVPLLGYNGEMAMDVALATMRDAVQGGRNLEGSYARQDSKRPYTPSDAAIGKCWARHYSAISTLLSIKQADAKVLDCYRPYLDTYLALNYYLLSSHWGGVPFDMEQSLYGSAPILRTQEDSVLTAIASTLKEALPELEEKRNDSFTDINSALFVSKDVARVLLAYTYCNLKRWDAALPLLEKVIGNGFYSITESQPARYAEDSECILGFKMMTRTAGTDKEECHPCLDYKEVVLTAAECLYHTGNTAKAQEYLSLICRKKGITADRSDLLQTIASVRYQIQSPDYLVFIRRNGLGPSFMGLSNSQTYQLLWPIPASERERNPHMTQNPGY